MIVMAIHKGHFSGKLIGFAHALNEMNFYSSSLFFWLETLILPAGNFLLV